MELKAQPSLFIRQYLPRMLLIAALYVLLATAALRFFAIANGNVSLVWPSSGLALAALLVGGRQYVWAVLLGAFVTNALQGSPLHIALLIGIGGALSALMARQLLSNNTFFDPALQRPRDYFSLMAAAALSALVSATVGVVALWSAGILPSAAGVGALLNWWQGDALGILLVTPLILVWQRCPRRWFSSMARTFETLACFGLLVLSGQVEFLDRFSLYFGAIEHLHPTFLFVVWAAVRFGRRGVTLVIVLTAIQALIGAARGTGAFAHDIEQTHMLNFWFYALTLSTVGISMALSIAHRQHVEAKLKQSETFKDVILNSVAAEIAVIDNQGTILAVNERWRQFALSNTQEPGQPPPNTGVGSNYLSVCAVDAATDHYSKDACQGIFDVLQGRKASFAHEYPCHSPAQKRWFNMMVMPLRFNGQDGATITHTEITEMKQVDERMRQSESHLRAVFDAALDAVIGMDDQGRITEWNKQAETIFGWQQAEALGLRLHDIIAPAEHRVAHQSGMAHFLATGQSTILNRRIEINALRRNGEEFPVELSILPFKTAAGYQFTAFLADISQRKAKETQLQEISARLRASEAHYRLLTENVSDVVWRQDRGHRFTYISPADERLRGFRADEVIGKHAFELMTDEGIALVAEINQRLKTSPPNDSNLQGVTFEAQQRCKDGSLVWTEIVSIPELNAQGEVIGYHGISRNITERKRMQDEVRHLAYFDPLTQLPNRRMLNDRLNQTMATSKRSGRFGALMILDLDNFKPLNDQHGHLVGDLLLVEVAHRLLACVREMDTVARFGGDEFVVMLNELDEDKAESYRQALVVAEKIRQTLAAPYVLRVSQENQTPSTVEHHCTASIGVALFVNHDVRPENIIQWADAAMYRAKDAGRNVIRFHAAA